MSSPGTYGFLNAKVRTRRSRLLDLETCRAMAQASSLQEACTLLSRNVHFRDAEKFRHREEWEIDHEITRAEIRDLRSLKKGIKGAFADYLTRLLERIDIQRLKQLIRARHNSSTPFMRDGAVYDFPADAMLEAGSLDSFAAGLESTPFHETFRRFRTGTEIRHFDLEVALDRLGFQRLWESTRSFSESDREIARRFLGVEADLWNLQAVTRYREYTGIPVEEFPRIVLPYGHWVPAEEWVRIAEGRPLPEKIRKQLSITALPVKPGDDVKSRQMLEQILWEVLRDEAEQVFSGFPFSVGVLAGYTVLLRLQSFRVRLILQGKRMNLPAETILHRLV
ncbi:MAG TPA: hypothetical protein ENN03_11100 [bacterium]|nr:hypothetical protein [bacterium]